MEKEMKHEVPKPKRITPAMIASMRPTNFAVGGKVFEMEDFSGVTACTIKERLKKADVTVSTKVAERICDSINGKKKGE